MTFTKMSDTLLVVSCTSFLWETLLYQPHDPRKCLHHIALNQDTSPVHSSQNESGLSLLWKHFEGIHLEPLTLFLLKQVREIKSKASNPKILNKNFQIPIFSPTLKQHKHSHNDHDLAHTERLRLMQFVNYCFSTAVSFPYFFWFSAFSHFFSFLLGFSTLPLHLIVMWLRKGNLRAVNTQSLGCKSVSNTDCSYVCIKTISLY